MGSVILWMFLYGSPRDFVQPERFSSMEACESFVYQVRVAAKQSGTDFTYRGHLCFEDYAK